MSKKALLMILDGWGIGNHSHSNAIYSTPTPYWKSLLAEYPNSQLLASGEDVGLPEGQMGNSEVGHLNIGAGRSIPGSGKNKHCMPRQQHPEKP